VDQTESTNADVLAAAAAGEPEGLVVVAQKQTAGRGRMRRTWESPAGGGLWFSVLLRPGDGPLTADGALAVPAVSPARFGWLPLLAGVALAETVNEVAQVEARLKWPNDLMIEDAKCAGILAEATGTGAIALGVGLNTMLGEEQLPPTPSGAPATSLRLAGAAVLDNAALLDAFLDHLGHWYAAWRAAAGDAQASGVRQAYLESCATIGREVRAILPGGAEIGGRAGTVDDEGRLLVAGLPVAAADVVHLRPMA
jgi:BirA family biotin operon repressor/biotin-[acetyl-CoA-carboxylase] ligase